MLSLIRRQEVFDKLTIWLVHSGLTASVLMGLLSWKRAGGSQVDLPVLLLVVAWISIGTFLLFGKVRRRCSELDLTLPYSTWRLWAAHVAAVSVCAFGLVAIVLGVAGVHRWGLGRLGGGEATRADFLGLTLLLLAGSVLAVVLVESRRLELQKPPFSAADLSWRLVVAAGIALASVWAVGYPWLGALALLVIAALVAGVTLRRLPETFLVLSPEDEIDRVASGPTAEWSAGSLGGLRFLARLIAIVHGARFGAWAPVMMFPFIALCGAMASGMFGIWADLEDLRFLYIPLYVYMLFNSLPAGMEQLAHLDSLPVSRRSMFAVLVVPLLLSFVVGYGVGALVIDLRSQSAERIVYAPLRGEDHYRLSVPMAYNGITTSSVPPQITSPWGETHTPRAVRLARFAPLYGYSPFSTPEGSSPEFVALQMSRAVEAVYGVRVDPVDIERRYLEVTGEGVALRTEGLTLEEDLGLEPVWGGPLFPTFFALTAVPFLLLAALFQRSYRPDRRASSKRKYWILVLAAAMGVLILQLALSIAGVSEMWALRALIEIPVQQLGTSVPGAVFIWLMAATCTALAYRFAESVFFRSELPVKPTVLKLI